MQPRADQGDVASRGACFRDRHALLLAMLLLLTGGIIFLRSHTAFLWPVLFAEDGRDVFSYFRNHRSPDSIFRFYAGYVSLLPNLAGHVSARMSPTLAVRFLGACALAVAMLAHSVFFLKRFRSVVPSDRARFLICLVTTVLPIGNFVLDSAVSYSLWNLLLILCLLSIVPTRAGRWATVAETSLLALAACSHPLSVVVIPVLFVRVWRCSGRLPRLSAAVLAVVIVAYSVIGVRPGEAGSPGVGRTAVSWLALLSERVVFEAFLGNALRDDMRTSRMLWAVHGASIALMLLFVSLTVRGFRGLPATTRAFLLWTTMCLLGLALLSVIGRRIDASRDPGIWGQRYTYVPQLLLLYAVGVLLSVPPQCAVPGRRRRLAMAAAAIVAIAVAGNARNRVQFTTSREDGRVVAEYLRVLEADGNPPRRDHVLSRGSWSIRVLAGR